MLVAAVVAGALAVPGVASAAPSVAATAVPGVPQDCQAGCIGSLSLICAATDALAVRTTVHCWINNSFTGLSAWQDLPAAVVRGNLTNPITRGYTLCVEGTARYSDGSTASSGVHCTTADVGPAAVAG